MECTSKQVYRQTFQHNTCCKESSQIDISAKELPVEKVKIEPKDSPLCSAEYNFVPVRLYIRVMEAIRRKILFELIVTRWNLRYLVMRAEALDISVNESPSNFIHRYFFRLISLHPFHVSTTDRNTIDILSAFRTTLRGAVSRNTIR